MTAYIAVSFSKRNELNEEINAVKTALQHAGATAFVFVDRFIFDARDETAMMRQAMNCIDECDVLIALLTHKAIGVGVEAGYARAKNKPVIYARHADAAHSTTVSGISSYQVIYTCTEDLQLQLAAVMQQLP